jgi:pyruvate/2-oxoglutarate dehydrogenase complex dihydrolipoamide dehydrogenase (E3) component
MNKTYDFLVIGGGSAGYAAARTAHDLGLSTAVIDGAAELGGLCILRGCMPSKSLIESANRFRAMRRAPEFGLRSGAIEVRPDEIIARKRRLIADFADYRQGQLADGRFDLIRATAAFTGPHSVEVTAIEDGTTSVIEFKTALIATGSSVSRVPIRGLEEAGYWTSDEVLEAEVLPDSIIVLGGGAIALEMACYMEGLGKEVTVIQRSKQILSGADPDIAGALATALSERDNLTLFTGTSIREVRHNAGTGQKTVIFNHGSDEVSVSAAEILYALGRSPNTSGLNLEAADVEVEGSGGKVVCHPDQRTSAPHIFAGGDVCGPHEVVHIAIEQGEIAAHNAAVLLGVTGDPVREISYRLKLLGIFTDPEVATVGLSEAEARAGGHQFATATYPFNDHGKSMIKGEMHGFVKMIADVKTGKILGASVVGPEAVEIIHEVVVAMYFGATTEEFLKIPHYHPSISEIWTYPAEDLSISG